MDKSFEAKERVCFPGEDKFVVIGPCGDKREVYATAPTMEEAVAEANKLTIFWADEING